MEPEQASDAFALMCSLNETKARTRGPFYFGAALRRIADNAYKGRAHAPIERITKFNGYKFTGLAVVPITSAHEGRRAEPVDAAFASYAGFEDAVHAG